MITQHQQGDTLWITLDRPDKANALTKAMLTDLRDAVLGAQAKVIVLTGAGKVFCAGMDLQAAQSGLATDPVWEELSHALAHSPALTIAALNGTAAGGSLGMVLACSLRVAVPGARLFYPVMRLGFLPQPSDPGRCAHLIGAARTRRLFLAGEKIAVEEAAQWGLIDRIAEDVPGAVADLSAAALAGDPAHIAAIKACVP